MSRVFIPLILSCGTLLAAAPAQRPNFVFLLTDDQLYDQVGVIQREQEKAGRFPWFQTPVLDKLAAEGVRFRNAFVVTSLCSPSRAAFLTGKYGHKNGITGNYTAFPEQPTYATILHAAGYRTGFFGKWHMGDQHGKRPGFDTSVSFIGQGEYFDCPMEFDGKPTLTKGWVDDVSTEYALQFLRERIDQQPFLLVVHFKTPHGGDPEAPPRTKGRYEGKPVGQPPDTTVRAPYLPPPEPGEKLKTHAKLTAMGHFDAIAGVEDDIAKLLTELDSLGVTDDTMVVFASDNGQQWGGHQLKGKESTYEPGMRVPMIVRYPRLASRGKVVDGMALNIDLAPTFLDYAGLPIPPDMQGRSWRPLLEGDGTNWRKSFFYEFFAANDHSNPTSVAVRTDDAKLIYYPDHPEMTELFDLKADPFEIHNFFADPAHVELRKKMEAEFEAQKVAVGFDKAPETKKKKKKG